MSHPYPLKEEVLCSYIAILTGQGLKHRTLKAYLSGIRYLQIKKALGNPFCKRPDTSLVICTSRSEMCQGASGVGLPDQTTDYYRHHGVTAESMARGTPEPGPDRALGGCVRRILWFSLSRRIYSPLCGGI